MALTTIPAAGAKLRGATLSSLITEVRPVFAYKTSDETITANATPQNDDDLVLAVEANAVYRGWLHIVWQSGTTPDFRHTLSLPTGATANKWSAISSLAIGETGALNAQTSLAGSGANITGDFTGVLVISSTAGNAQWQWSQQTSDAGSTIVRAGSYFMLQRVS